MGSQAFETKRTTAFLFEPEKLVIIGLDTKDGPEHHLYDERIKQKIPDSMVKNIEACGVIEAVTITKIGEQPVVVDGRRRVMAARLANKKLTARGEVPVTVPSLIKRGDPEILMGVLISGNEHRLDDDAITRAEKAERLRSRGMNNVQIGIYFGVSGTAVGNWLKVLDCIPAVKNAVRAGKISMSAAIELSDLSPEEQEETLIKMLDSGKKSVNDAKNHNGGSNGGTVAPKKTLVRKIVEHRQASNVLGDGFLKGILWAIGDLETISIKGLSDIVEDVV